MIDALLDLDDCFKFIIEDPDGFLKSSGIATVHTTSTETDLVTTFHPDESCKQKARDNHN